MSWQYQLCDIATNTLILDLTPLARTGKVSSRLNRPMSVELTMPCDTPALWANWTDGNPALEGATRCIKAIQDGTLRANVLVWSVGPTGDANSSEVLVTGFDPMQLLQRRPFRDSSGDFSTPSFPSPVSGGKLVRDAVVNSVAFEGALPMTTTSSNFDLLAPPASDLSSELTSFPLMIGDMITLLTNTGCVDVVCTPRAVANSIANLHGVIQYGTDKTSTVHFDYATGIHNVSNARRSFTLDELCNKLWYYLGPKKSDNPMQFRGNITGTEVGVNTTQQLAITGSPTGGSYTLSFRGSNTVLAYNASAAAIQAALVSLPSIGSGNATVTGSGPFTIEFVNLFAEIDIEEIGADGSALTGGSSPAAAITTTQHGRPGNSAEQALQLASRTRWLWTLMDISIYDDGNSEGSARPMFTQLWKTEVRFRVNPLERLFMTPLGGDDAPFRPFIDYDRGDIVAVNTGAALGNPVSADQRVYGFDVTTDADGVEKVSELIVSADQG